VLGSARGAHASDVDAPARGRELAKLSDESRRRIVLVGMMGAGKTVVGIELARRLGWRWWDNDVELQRDTGRDARMLVVELGIDAAHAEETRVLLRALSLDEPAVVAAAGSVVADPVAVDALQREWVVWLRARVDTLLRRVESGQHRPFVDADAQRTFEQLDNARRGTYARLAALVVDVDDLTVAEVVERILAAAARVT
jgi:shikimate kinase